jgi:hypothetical protein
VRVADRVQQLLKDIVAFDFADAEQLGPLAVVELVDRDGEVGQLGGLGLRGPALRHGELQVSRDRV